jgi:predicted CXXCH cytochrome family protein
MQGNDFTQSVMYRRGVTCFSCHDVHGTGNDADTIKPARDLFCPRCHTAVVLVDDEHCPMTEPGSLTSHPCKMSTIRPQRGDTSDQAEARASSTDPDL